MKPKPGAKDRMRFLILLLGLEFLAASYDVAFTKSSKHILRKWNLLDKTLVKDKVRPRRCHVILDSELIFGSCRTQLNHTYTCTNAVQVTHENEEISWEQLSRYGHTMPLHCLSLFVSLTSDL